MPLIQNDPTSKPDLLYRANQDIETIFGTYEKGSLFRILFKSPDGTYSQAEDAEPVDGRFPHAIYVQTSLFDEAPDAVAKVPAPLTIPPVVEYPSLAPVAAVEAPEAIVEPIADVTEAPAPKKRSRKTANTAS